MESEVQQAVIEMLAREPTGRLETFFGSHGLGAAFRRPSKGWGREKRINEALATAEAEGHRTEVLEDAVRYFGHDADRHVPRNSSKGAQPKRPTHRLAGMHPAVRDAASGLFDDGHYGAAILEAAKVVVEAVKEASGLPDDGTSLMSRAFGGDTPRLRLNRGRTQTDRDEQEGFKFLFMGAMLGVRNPKAHARFERLEPERALEYLSFLSLLRRRVDDAVEGRS